MRLPQQSIGLYNSVIHKASRCKPTSPLVKLCFKSDKSGSDIVKAKQTSAKSAPAPIPNNLGIEKLLLKNNKPYIPKLKHERVSFEFPGLPNQDDFAKHATEPKIVNRWSKYIPKILGVLAILWGGYTIKVWYFDSLNDSGENSKDLLDPSQFHKFRITHKEQIDDDHYLIELRPKHTLWQYSYLTSYDSKSIWNGDRIWSVEIKQPEIMVVRSYTPLPLYFMKSEHTRSGEKKPLLRVVNNDLSDYDKQGSMCLYVKKYGDGEVSRYITSKELGDELELRGPHVEYRFPHHPLKEFHERPIFRDLPSKVESEYLVEKVLSVNKLPPYDNLDFYAAGTGIAPALQVLLSRNPYRGFINLHYSAQKPGELEPLERFLFFLEKLDRIKLYNYYDDVSRLSSVDSPEESNYLSPLRLDSKLSELSPEESLKLRMKVLEGSTSEAKESSEYQVERFENALEQAVQTSQHKKSSAALAVVCGPDGYVDFVAGKKDRVRNEQGEVAGLLGEKNWDSLNVYKL